MMNIYEAGLLLKIKSIIKVILIISSKVLSRICLANTAVSFSTRNLTYQYNNLSAPVINKFNLDIKSGESIAIVGPSGVGKTTLMKLMSGLLKPSAGSLLVNGLDIHTIGINNYRQCIACVLQDGKLFAGSIAENIASFESSLDIEWVMGCARHCNIHDDIMKLPMAYETLLGELGGGLSGGQKQRLLIARALYRRPGILFMDEATGHLDLANEAYINASIAGLAITRVIITHRPSTITSADRIITLD